MPERTPEKKAREQIDAMLAASGWGVQDYKAFCPSAARGIALREVPLKSGRCDYLLLVERRALGVVEAKKAGVTLSTVADQSGHYGENLPDFIQAITPGKLPFLYESTGVETFFRDNHDPDPRSRHLFSFHRPETLAAWAAEPDTLRHRLAQMPVVHPLARTGMRDCQFEANTALEHSFRRDARRSLVQMATGSGKTYLACAFSYRLIKFAGARRILFLVDRANLGRQAKSEFDQFVPPDDPRKLGTLYNIQHLTSNQLDPVARVSICTIQRLYSMLRGEELDENVDEKSVAFDKLLLGVALGKRDEDTITTLAGRLARLDREISRDEANTLSHIAGGKTLAEMSAALLCAVNPDAIAERAAGKSGASPDEAAPEKLAAAQKQLMDEACAPFDSPALRDALAKAKQEAEQTIDTVTIDTVTQQGFDAAARKKAASLLKSFRNYIEQHRAEIAALQILYSRPYRQRLTELMLKELENKLRENHAAWTEDRLWDAFAAIQPGKVKGRSQAGRFADLVALVRFALEQQPVLEPFAESVHERFNEWLMDKAKAGTVFVPGQLAWLNLIRDHIATSLSIEREDFDYAPFTQRGGLGKAYQLFGNELNRILDELNLTLVA